MASGSIGEGRSTGAPRLGPAFLSRRTAGDAVFDSLNVLFLGLFCLTILYPFWSTILMSFSDAYEMRSMGFRLWLRHWSTISYQFAFSEYGNVGTAYVNSILRAVAGTGLTIAMTFLGAYPLSKRNLPGRNALTIFLLITMYFGGGLVPTYLLIRSLGLIDSRWALVLPGMAGGFNIIIVRNFIMAIDSAYEESAFIDGASYLQSMARIMFPLCKPVIATVALWSVVGHWNAWFDALIYINSESKIVLQLLLRRMLQKVQVMQQSMRRFELEALNGNLLPSEGVQAAVTVITIGPIILVYPFFQRYFVKGVFIGSLKG